MTFHAKQHSSRRWAALLLLREGAAFGRGGLA